MHKTTLHFINSPKKIIMFFALFPSLSHDTQKTFLPVTFAVHSITISFENWNKYTDIPVYLLTYSRDQIVFCTDFIHTHCIFSFNCTCILFMIYINNPCFLFRHMDISFVRLTVLTPFQVQASVWSVALLWSQLNGCLFMAVTRP